MDMNIVFKQNLQGVKYKQGGLEESHCSSTSKEASQGGSDLLDSYLGMSSRIVPPVGGPGEDPSKKRTMTPGLPGNAL